MFRSTDGGSHISLVAQLHEEVTAIVASPAFDADHTVIVGTPTGLYRSTDEGRTWDAIGNLGRHVTSLAISPDFEQDRQMFVGTPSGLFTTTDGGDRWTRVGDEAVGDDRVIEAVALSPSFASDGTVLASVGGRGLFKSVDGGKTFTSTAAGLLESGVVLSSFYHRTSEPIVFSPDYADDHTVYGMADTTLFKSTDGGETWKRVPLPVTTHDTSRGAAPSPLLPTAVYGGHVDDRSFSTPIGRLSTRRVIAAALGGLVAFAVLFPMRRRVLWGRRPLGSIAVRLLCSTAVIAVGLLVLAA
jgi:photosystem II stability/assembly factor-like uncharacterized protein